MATQFELGDVAIHRVVESQGPFFKALEFFPTSTPELLDANKAWLQPTYLDADGRLIVCVQSYVVRTPHHNILIDSCVGNHKPRPHRPAWHMQTSDRYAQSLAAAAGRPAPSRSRMPARGRTRGIFPAPAVGRVTRWEDGFRIG